MWWCGSLGKCGAWYRLPSDCQAIIDGYTYERLVFSCMLGWTPDWLMIGVALAMIASCRVIPSLLWPIITTYTEAVWQAKHKRKYASDRFICDWPRIWSWSMATILWHFCYNYCFTSYASVSSHHSILDISYCSNFSLNWKNVKRTMADVLPSSN